MRLWDNPQGGARPIVHALARRGGLHLAKIDPAFPSTDWTTKNRKAREEYIDHTLGVTRFRAALTLGCTGAPFTLERFITGRALVDSVELQHGREYLTVPVVPDGFFTIGRADAVSHFMLEIDRATEPLERARLTHRDQPTSIFKKLLAYLHYRVQRKHEAKYGIRGFRVLFVTTTAGRAVSMHHHATRFCEEYAATVKGGHPPFEQFWITTADRCELDNPAAILTAPIWMRAGDDTPRPLYS